MGKNIKYSLEFFVRLQGNFIHSFAFKGFVGAWDSLGAAGLELLFPIKYLCSQIRAPPDSFALQHLSSKLGSLAFGKRVTTCWGFKQKSLGFKTYYLASWWFSRMEDRGSVQQVENEKRCQIEGCNDVTVGARTSLCRKHRNNKYKQNYKKKKRKAQGSEENQGETPESQLAAEKYHLEQKYASMLQQVLVQKRLELLQSPSICNLLRIHQQSVREDKQVQLLEKRKAAQGEHNSKMQQEKQSKPLSSPNISTSGANNICNSGTTAKTANGPSKTTSSSKTLVKSSKQSSRPPQGRNPSKHSKNRNNSNSSVESPLNGLIVPHSKITSNGSESVAHALYASSASWNLNEKKAEFCNIRQVQNLQQQLTPQPMLVNTTQEAFSQQKQEQQKASHNMQVQLLQHHYQQHNIQKDHLQFLQHQNLLEQVHQKQLQEKKHHQQQQHIQQQQQQHRLQDQQFVHQQQQLSQQRRLQQQQRQQELHIQLQNSRQQQQLQQQQRQQLQVSGLQNQQFHQQQLQTCTSVPSSVKSISDTELFLQSLPSIQSSMSSLLVSQSLVNTSSHDSVHTSGILTTRSSVLPRTLLTNTQGKTPNIFPISHMGSNAPSVSSHRPIAPRLEGHSSINNTLCNGGMPIITAIISAPLTQHIMPQSGANVERNSIHEVNTHTPMNSSCNALNPQYPLVPFNVQMDLNLLQGVGAQFSEHNMQCASTQVRGRQMLLE